MEGMSNQKQQLVHYSPPLEPLMVYADARRLKQILVNLLGNAAVHTSPTTKVEFSARAEADQLVLRVADNGPGLPPGDTARWFDRFQRGPDAVAGGTGIGLSLVKGFAEAQGGSVSAENQASGGAVFTVKLPLTQLPPVPEEKE